MDPMTLLRRLARPGVFLILLAVAAPFAACSAKVTPALPPGFDRAEAPQPLVPYVRQLEREGERNWVLNLMELSVEALRIGEREWAEKALDVAIQQIEIIYGDSEQARRARSLWYAEESKVFKGDPYERSMVYLYRGLLFMQREDWQNARACFRSVLVQDSFAEEDQNRADWALPLFLIGVCETQLGRPEYASEQFERAEEFLDSFPDRYEALGNRSNPDGGSVSPIQFDSLPGKLPQRQNLVIITQHGDAPWKVGAGRYGQLLTYAPGGGAYQGAQILINQHDMGKTAFVDSVYYQAVTRGGRELDVIQNRQAKFKGTGEDVGKVGVELGKRAAVLGLAHDNRDVAAAGAGVLIVGSLLQGISSLVRPEADLRAWRTLPDALGLYSVLLRPGVYDIVIEYARDARMGRTVRAQTDVNVQGEQDLTVLLVFSTPEVFIVGPPGSGTP